MIGKVVAHIRYLNDDELDNEGRTGRVTEFKFTDGSLLYAANDNESNDAGVLVIRENNGTTNLVAPVRHTSKREINN
jgi:hypothetical protein